MEVVDRLGAPPGSPKPGGWTPNLRTSEGIGAGKPPEGPGAANPSLPRLVSASEQMGQLLPSAVMVIYQL